MGTRERYKRGGSFVPRQERNGFMNARILSHQQQNSSDSHFEMEIKNKLDKFQKSNDELSLSLPPMNREERKRVHEVARKMRLNTKSAGDEPYRYIVISKRGLKTLTRASSLATDPITLSEKSKHAVAAFTSKFTIKEEDVEDFLIEKTNSDLNRNRGNNKIRAMVPPRVRIQNNDIMRRRRELPSYKYQQLVIEAIRHNNVVIVSGGTGCGKTTQIPQFILEEAAERNEKVQIMCTQPRRLAAISIAERVCKERNEKLGDAVGYHIRLEQKTSENTMLTYCTSGVLLRKLSVDPLALGITHIILDEIHERETNTDYLLIALKQALRTRQDLKIILMSATIEGNMNLFESYFQERNVHILRIESKLFDVQKIYLDDILAMIGYEPPESFGFFPIGNNENAGDSFPSMGVWNAANSEPFSMTHANTMPNLKEVWTEPNYSQPPIFSHPSSSQECITNANGEWLGGSYRTIEGDVITESAMKEYMTAMGGTHILPTVYSQPPPPIPTNLSQPPPPPVHFGQPPNFNTNSNSNGLGCFNIPENTFGASMRKEQAIEQQYRHDLKNALPNRLAYFLPEAMQQVRHIDTRAMNLEAKYLACGGNQYIESVDWDLVNETIKYIADSPIFGSILVFLPGYEDILQVREKIDEWKHGLNNYSLVNVICLHSQMNSADQSEVFKTVPRNVRKIILSTNIAEASVTIEDVIFVIDTGKVKEKVYSHDTKISQLKVATIAKSNADQRSGRAGRVTNGYCFRLYSEKAYFDMPQTQLAEMQRSAIYDVCLHAKLFAPKGMRVAEFLGMAPEPPKRDAIEKSMEFLEQLGALYSHSKTAEDMPAGDYDEDEDPELTDFGRIMAQMPLDPQLSRLLIFGLALKCLSPIVNLVALLSYRDPYLIPNQSDREALNKTRDRLAARDFSDHLVFIRLVDEFSKLNFKDSARYCRENYLNANTMRMIVGVRRQLFFELVRAKLIDSESEALTNVEYNMYSSNWPMIQAAISAGCYPYIGVSVGNSNKLRKIQTHADNFSSLHPSSVIRRQTNLKTRGQEEDTQLQFVAYQELCLMDGSLALRHVTVIPAITVLLFTGPIRSKQSIITDYQLVNENGQNDDSVAPTSFLSFETYEIEPWYSIRSTRKVSFILQFHNNKK
ncbi:unnamed protein product [Caenorhabditis angaria]|uniref:Uncharacterized protein n=1 Tax=Caenorhabditis angaria TaxID=860376 RepID=A0A9P1I0P8_9PELO|nr:unnamed protein product [Caenorhabditis angaria]